jgi:hypothetical protein
MTKLRMRPLVRSPGMCLLEKYQNMVSNYISLDNFPESECFGGRGFEPVDVAPNTGSVARLKGGKVELPCRYQLTRLGVLRGHVEYPLL